MFELCNPIEVEEKILRPYASFSNDSTRMIKIAEPISRSQFQRDKDRIIHSKSFRRLEYKTQVFLTQHNDHLRTRLTHTLEVAQIARSVSIRLGLNCDLVEAISLGHDIGHTPFGHAGEEELEKCLKIYNLDFKHNIQSVRIIERLEEKYVYNGLNLSTQVKEGILKHTKIRKELAQSLDEDLFLDIPFSVTLEGQVVAISDEIAQISNDLDDYIAFGIVSLNDIMKNEIYPIVEDFFIKRYKITLNSQLEDSKSDNVKQAIIVRTLVDYFVTTLVEDSITKINEYEELKSMKIPDLIVDFNIENKKIYKNFKEFVFSKIKTNGKIKEMDTRAHNIIRTLFTYYSEFPEKLPIKTKQKYDQTIPEHKPRIIADHIAGMTDRYALSCYDKIIIFD